MQKTMNYEAQDGETEALYIQKFFAQAVGDLEGVDTSDKLDLLSQAVKDAETKVTTIENSIDAINQHYLSPYKTAKKQWEGQAQKWTILEEERRSAGISADEKASSLIVEIENQKKIWDAFGEGKQGPDEWIAGKLPGYASVAAEFDKELSAYKEAVTNKNYSELQRKLKNV